MAEYEELRRVLAAATPGPWRAWACAVGPTDGGRFFATTNIYGLGAHGGRQEMDDARYIAAANPQAVLTLLDRLEEAERLLRQANQQHVYRHFGQKCDCESCTFGDEIDAFLTTHTGEPNG